MTNKSLALRVALCILMLFASLALAWGDERTDEVSRVKASAEALDDIMAAPDKGIPEDIMESAVCVGVVPGLKKGGFIFGAEYGKGVASCRDANGWSAPAPFKVVGGSGASRSAGKLSIWSC